MHQRTLFLLGSCLLATAASAQVTTKLVISGLTKPLWAGAPQGDPRVFVAVKAGRMRVVENGALAPGYFLDISSKVSTGSEQGLLGVAFHPDYASNGFFYVNYTDLAGDTVVSRFQVTADPDAADPNSESVVLTQSQPFTNHNGGDLHFGPDGYLYVFFGDGGDANDPACRAQNMASWLGKVLRIDVDSGSPYAIPPDNPFVGVAGARPEIYHTGVRNPWRNGIDLLTGDIYIGDVGQDQREEISFASAGVGGLNFGWKMMEANRCNLTGSCGTVPPCNDGALELPIVELLHSSGAFCITGGTVYRGCAVPGEQGKYFFSDYFDDKIRSCEYDTLTGSVSNLQDRTAEFAPGGGRFIRNIASFGVDGFGELLIIDHTGAGEGEVFRMVPAGAPAATAVARNGSGVNRSCFTSHSLPILGNLWEARVDASAHPGATLAVLSAFTAPGAGSFVGSNEILVSGSKLFSLVQPSTGSTDVFRAALPCDAALAGAVAYTQAVILGGGIELCNALDVTAGYY